MGCERCHGIGFHYETVDGREWAKACSCRSRGAAETRGSVSACRIPPRHRGFTLGNFEPRSEAQQAAYRRALAYCEGFPQRVASEGLGLLFWGPADSGKTHLATGILSELVASRNLSGQFWEFAALVQEMGRAYDKRSGITVFDTLQGALDVDLLLLDDLGSRRIPDWAHNTLFEIVDARYRARRPTLVTTAFEDADLASAAGAEQMRRDEYLIDRIGARVRSRLLEMCLFVPMQERRRSAPPFQPTRPSTLAAMRRRG